MSNIEFNEGCKSNSLPLIPRKYSFHNGNISPPITIKQIKGAKSYALLMCDPDVPEGIVPNNTWYHWFIQYIPPTYKKLKENASKTDKNIIQSHTTWTEKGRMTEYGYGGPSPPPDQTHRYIFNVYALKCSLKDSKLMSPEEFIKLLQKDKNKILLNHSVYCGIYKTSEE
jgi:Raf kinase inhibitor-like YbhB/YbcL family protein